MCAFDGPPDGGAHLDGVHAVADLTGHPVGDGAVGVTVERGGERRVILRENGGIERNAVCFKKRDELLDRALVGGVLLRAAAEQQNQQKYIDQQQDHDHDIFQP